MKTEDKLEALNILSSHKSVTLSLNVPVADSYSNCYDLLLNKANAHSLNDLIEAGFKLSMTDKGLSVDKY